MFELTRTEGVTPTFHATYRKKMLIGITRITSKTPVLSPLCREHKSLIT